ncbi:winged helix-turn-helix domain-containing protein [Planctomycetota bacterium]
MAKYRAGVKMWVAGTRAKGVFGEGKFKLLQAVGKFGSLRKAADKHGISYRKAWGELKKAEERIGEPLLIRERGGSQGGNSQLTPFAEELLKSYAAFKDDVQVHADKAFKKRLGKYFK